MILYYTGCNDNAVDTTGSQKSQVSIAEQEDFGVRCPCGCNEVKSYIINIFTVSQYHLLSVGEDD